jgi:hypothetical protein
MLKLILLGTVLAFTACKLGPFPDEPVEQPEAPLPSGWVGHGVSDGGLSDGGLSDDAAAPVANPDGR